MSKTCLAVVVTGFKGPVKRYTCYRMPDLMSLVVSPSLSDCDSVSGLIENGNCDTSNRMIPNTCRIQALQQVVLWIS